MEMADSNQQTRRRGHTRAAAIRAAVLPLLAVALAACTRAAKAQGDELGGFPWCRCDRTAFDTPFIIQNVTVAETPTTRDYTFTFGTSGCLITSPCCGMDMNKVEFHAREGCDASMVDKIVVKTIRVDYSVVIRQHSVQFRSYGNNRLIFKVTNLRWLYEDVEDSTITVSLVKGSACDTLSTFLEGTNTAFVDKGSKCCPTLPLPPLP